MAHTNPQDPRIAASKRKHYEANKEKYKEQAKARRRELQAVAQKAKDVPCADCGGRFHYVAMDFDHLGDKVMSVANMVQQGSLSKLLAEIAKCEVVCSNCHRVRTWTRGQNGAYADMVRRQSSKLK